MSEDTHDGADDADDGRAPRSGPDGAPLDLDGRASPPLGRQLARLAVVAVVLLFVVFALANAQHVDFSWVVGATEVVDQGGERTSGGVRLIVLLLAAFAAGGVVGAVLARPRVRR